VLLYFSFRTVSLRTRVASNMDMMRNKMEGRWLWLMLLHFILHAVRGRMPEGH